MSLPAARRGRIIRQVIASRAGHGQGRLPAAGFLPLRLPAATWAAALAFVLLLVSAGYVWQPGGEGIPATTAASRADGSLDLEVTQVADAVVLQWRDGPRDSFTVRQATSARMVREAPGVQVRGTRYVDRSASDAPVVYYLVE